MYFKSNLGFIGLVITLLFLNWNGLLANNKAKTLKEYFESFSVGKSSHTHDSWITPDKGYHVIGSLISTTLAGQLSLRTFETTRQNSQIIGAGISVTLGVLKEFHDAGKENNIFSWKDLAANGVGILLGIVLLGID